MSTRRPKVPKPSGLPGGTQRRASSAPDTRPASSHPGTEEPQARGARLQPTGSRKPVDGKPESGKTGSAKTGSDTGGSDTAGTGHAGRKPSQPRPAGGGKSARPAKTKPAKPAKPADPSAARAAARQELAAEIRRDVPQAESAEGKPRTEPALKPVPAKSFSGRLLALGIVMVVITVLLAPSVRTFLQQRSEIAALEAEIAEEQKTGQELEQTLDRWEDPAYIKAQARERIFLVMPGETRYLVKGENGVNDVEEEAAADGPADLEWVDALWDSVVRSATAP
ncbi:FtsB family cell division protein [Arthrobacter sp. Edens01]|uniref:FtsB family cell division protein n=1 Tax=Arthrobacter sp. Edens01 TaxID=1732020 RepID=UPI000A8E5FF5|nr:septum formation initiator family protein [Arthrobacter sp. Edens01]